MKLDLLNRNGFIENVLKIVTQLSEIKKGCCFSIEGGWGVGKTFVLDEIENELKKLQSENTQEDRYFVFHYNCWQHDYYEEPAIAIISAMINSITEDSILINEDIDKTIKAGYTYLKKKLIEIASICIENKIGVNLVEFAKDISEIKQENIQNLQEFDKLFNFNKTMDQVRLKLEEIAKNRTIILIVDELDRCIPQYAIKVLERLHHIFYGLENIVVILAIDRVQLEHSVEEMFGYRKDDTSMDVEKYLKKFIDFSMILENGTINNTFKEKYMFYFDKFLIDGQSGDEEKLNKIIPILLMGIDIRRQEKIIQKASVVHSIVCNTKVDISVLVFEVLYEVLKLYKFENMEWIAVINDKSNHILEQKVGAGIMDLLKSMEKESWNGTKTTVGYNHNENKKCILFNLCGKIIWCFANVFNEKDMPYVSVYSCNLDKELEIVRKYREFCEIIK